jgi:hypothetical protein
MFKWLLFNACDVVDASVFDIVLEIAKEVVNVRH